MKENYGSSTTIVRSNNRVETTTKFYDYSKLEEPEQTLQHRHISSVPSVKQPLTPSPMNIGLETNKFLSDDFKRMHLPNQDYSNRFPGSARPISDMSTTNGQARPWPAISTNEMSDFSRRKERETDQQINQLLEEEADKKVQSKDAIIQRLRHENVSLMRNFKPKITNNVVVSPSSAPSPPASVSSSVVEHPFRKDDSSSENNSDSSLDSRDMSPPDASTFLAPTQPDSMYTLRKSRTEAENNVVNRNHNSNERAMSECQPGTSIVVQPSVNRRGSFGLSRTLQRASSSPNIAKALLNEKGPFSGDGLSNFAHVDDLSKPTFDRSVKPSLNGDFTQSRDFQPLYRSSSETAISPGLRNLGNTCFMNAVIQCLFNTHDFSHYFYRRLYKEDVNPKSKFGTGGQLCEEFGELMSNLALGNRQYKHITPSSFKRVVGRHIPFMGGYDQQDSHEFLLILLEKLHADLNRAAVQDPPPQLSDDLSPDLAVEKFWRAHLERNDSIVSKLFEGLILSTLECGICSNISNTFEVFSCLSLPIPQPNGRCKIHDCIRAFLQTEVIKGEAAWDCPKCKQKRESHKKTSIVKWPKVLLIQLKR